MPIINPCEPSEAALKSFFLGPQAENADWLRMLTDEVLEKWTDWRRSLFPEDGLAISLENRSSVEFLDCQAQFRKITFELMKRFENEVPKFSPRYVGHMFSETSLPALIGHFITLCHNPNNISGESSRVGVQIENESIEFLSQMVGYDSKEATGHFTSGGTIANFEALVRARARVKNPSQAVLLVPENKHYSWLKGRWLMGLSENALWPISLDRFGHLSIESLKSNLERALNENLEIMMVVSVIGSTELGGIDPVHLVQKTLDDFESTFGIQCWHHVDAAYGGFFCTLNRKGETQISEESKHALSSIRLANSITLDPHKMGYVPYSSGAFLCKKRSDYYLRGFENVPYLEYNTEIDRGPYTIEGSRSAAGAVATWMTAKTIGLNSKGYGLVIERTLKTKAELAKRLCARWSLIREAPGSDTNVFCFTIANAGEKLTISNSRIKFLYERMSHEKDGMFIVSKTAFQKKNHSQYIHSWINDWNGIEDSEELNVIRIVLMNPFFSSKEMNVDFVEKLCDEIIEKAHLYG